MPRIRATVLEDRMTPTITSYVTTEHMHLDIGFDDSSQNWSMIAHDSDNDVEYATDDVMMYVGTHQPQSQAAGYEFIGAGTGGSYFQLPPNPNNDLLTVAFTGLDVPSSLVDRYNPSAESKSRINSPARWLKVRLLDVCHFEPTGQRGDGQMSVWFGGTGSEPLTVFMSTFNDGTANANASGLDVTDGITVDDALWVPAGGHIHYNWGFTHKGRYDVTFRLSGYFGDGGSDKTQTIEGVYRESEPITVRYTVGSAGQVEFAAAETVVDETAGVALVTVHRVNGRDGQLTVNYATANGTATAGSDYKATTGTLTFADGETTRTVSVPIINDTLAEPSETVTLTLDTPGPNNLDYYLNFVGGAKILGSQTKTTLTIVNGDGTIPAPSVSQITLNNYTPIASAKSCTCGVATITTAVPHGLSAGNRVVLDGVSDSLFSGTVTIDAVPSPTSFTYKLAVAPSVTATGGLVAGSTSPANAQRSRLVNLAVTFSTPVDPSLLVNTPAAFTLTQDLPNYPAHQLTSAPTGGIRVTPLTANRVLLTFANGTPGVEFGSLADGAWNLRIHRTAVRSLADVVMANDYQSAGVDLKVNTNDVGEIAINRLFGDFDGNGAVNFADFLAFRTNFGGTGSLWNPFDVNGDGSVNFTDFLAFRTRFGTILP